MFNCLIIAQQLAYLTLHGMIWYLWKTIFDTCCDL